MDKASFYREALTASLGPLETTRVLDCTTAWAGPMAGCLLADLGADVIHIDLPGGLPPQGPPLIGGTSLNFVHQSVNRNKRSLSLDLRTAEGRDVFLDLVATVDVVIENFRPGTLDGWGIGWEAGCKADLGTCRSATASSGRGTERAGYDPAALAAGGWMSLNGSPDGPPVKAPTFLADDLAGLHGALSALAALRHRDGPARQGRRVACSTPCCPLGDGHQPGATDVPDVALGAQGQRDSPVPRAPLRRRQLLPGLLPEMPIGAGCEVVAGRSGPSGRAQRRAAGEPRRSTRVARARTGRWTRRSTRSSAPAWWWPA
ncbi:MAG: CoA transferase [Acidimicrobiales bacterium]